MVSFRISLPALLIACCLLPGCARVFSSASSKTDEFSTERLLTMAEYFESNGDHQRARELHEAIRLRDPHTAYLTGASAAPTQAHQVANTFNSLDQNQVPPEAREFLEQSTTDTVATALVPQSATTEEQTALTEFPPFDPTALSAYEASERNGNMAVSEVAVPEAAVPAFVEAAVPDFVEESAHTLADQQPAVHAMATDMTGDGDFTREEELYFGGEDSLLNSSTTSFAQTVAVEPEVKFTPAVAVETSADSNIMQTTDIVTAHSSLRPDNSGVQFALHETVIEEEVPQAAPRVETRTPIRPATQHDGFELPTIR